MLKGQCLCGAVKYHYLAPVFETIICHCRHCQMGQGTAFAYNSPLQKQYFVLEYGKADLKEYFHTPEKARVFCMHCASPIYSYRLDLPEIIRLRLGTVTEGELPAPKQQFYIERKFSFVSILEDQTSQNSFD